MSIRKDSKFVFSRANSPLVICLFIDAFYNLYCSNTTRNKPNRKTKNAKFTAIKLQNHLHIRLRSSLITFHVDYWLQPLIYPYNLFLKFTLNYKTSQLNMAGGTIRYNKAIICLNLVFINACTTHILKHQNLLMAIRMLTRPNAKHTKLILVAFWWIIVAV